MKVPLIGIMAILLVAIIFGGIAFPSMDDLALLLSSCMFFIIAWAYKKDKELAKEEE